MIITKTGEKTLKATLPLLVSVLANSSGSKLEVYYNSAVTRLIYKRNFALGVNANLF